MNANPYTRTKPMDMKTRFVKYELDRTVMYDFIDEHWYINGIRPPTNQYRKLYLQYCMDEDFKTVQTSFIKSKKRVSSASSKSSKTATPKKRKGKKIKRVIVLKK